MISDIISVVNFVAIVILFILFFTKNNKENFTGVPSGYTNLLVSDQDGNLDTFSLATLESDINTKITDAIKPLNTITSTLGILNSRQHQLESQQQQLLSQQRTLDSDSLKLNTKYYQKITNLPSTATQSNYNYVGWQNNGDPNQLDIWRQEKTGGNEGCMQFMFEKA